MKEVLYDNVGTGDRAWSQKLGRASFKLLFHSLGEILRAGHDAIVEGNFAPGISEAEFERLPPFRALQVFCVAPEPVLLDRFATRRRHPGHVDEIVLEEMRAGAAFLRPRPLEIGGEFIELDTGGPIEVTSIEARIRALLQSSDLL